MKNYGESIELYPRNVLFMYYEYVLLYIGQAMFSGALSIY